MSKQEVEIIAAICPWTSLTLSSPLFKKECFFFFHCFIGSLLLSERHSE